MKKCIIFALNIKYMIVKICSKCKIEKNVIEFTKDLNTNIGYRSQCKLCLKAQYIKRKSSGIKYTYNREKKLEYIKNNKEKIRERNQKYMELNKKSISDNKKKYYKENREKRIEYQSEYYKENRQKKIASHTNKMKSDDLYKFKHNTRTLIRASFKRFSIGIFKKEKTTEFILGCSIEYFTTYIQSKFKEGMTLQNHGKWHLDHIIPLSNAKSNDEIIKLNHYTNFQPLWAKENLSKGNKINNDLYGKAN